MTALDARRQALEALAARRKGDSQSHSSHPSRPAPLSPDSTILVPASSSPAATPTRPGLIPSSNLRAGGGGSLGSPASVLSALSNGASRGHDGGRTGASTQAISTSASANGNGYSLSDLSPSSPQPLSRLKKRYDDVTSPSKSASSSLPSPLMSSRASANSAGPSRKMGGAKLVAAAKQQHNAQTESQYQRLQKQFPTLLRLDIMDAIRRHGDDWDSTLKDLMATRARILGAKEERDRVVVTAPVRPQADSLPPWVRREHGGSSSSITSSAGSVASSSVSPSSLPPAAPKRRKKYRNEKSTIYAKREKARKRDPDEESEASAADSDDGSDEWSGEDTPRRKKRRGSDDDVDAEGEALRAFNEAELEVFTGTIACSEDQAKTIVRLRPYDDVDEVRFKLSKARGVSFKLFEQYAEIMEGYVQIDACLNRCEAIADDIAATLAVWKGASTSASGSVTGTPGPNGLNDVKVDVDKVSELLRSETNSLKRKILSSYLRTQPSLLSEGTVLKDYQLLGVNWLNLLWSRKIGCILADEMGLGKTIQVIAFLAHLKDRGVKGPHMIFVPSSTLENWTREFERFAPEIDVQTYHGSQKERIEIRDSLKHMFRHGKLEVVLASYSQVVSADDLNFLRKKLSFETCVYDEAHALKNFATKRYKDLLSIRPKWRLLLTGTPLQNNLQELVSLLMFIHKDVFADAEQYLRAIFKVQSTGHASLLSQQRVSRARTMLTPFVLRRRKANVLTLPPKIEKVEECEMTEAQARLYRDTLRRSRKAMREMGEEAIEAAIAADDPDGANGTKAKGKKAAAAAAAAKDKTSSANLLMDLRKAASHPLLFRRLYNANKVRQIARACLQCPQWCDSNYDYVVEDLEVMSDAEIHHFVSEHDDLAQFALDPDVFLEGGKMRALKTHIERCKAEGKRMLLFSQFTMVLDIVQVALDHLDVRFVRLDGQTRTDERQGLVDEFNDDPEITVFLLSTKAGGVGINLTAASVVVIFDQDFNPHNDRQAADRAYRIGQERSVEVIKFISKDSIDEDILSIGLTKLQLDDMVGGDDSPAGADVTADGTAGDDKTAAEAKRSLLTQLRRKFEQEGDANADTDMDAANDDEVEMVSATQVKRAQGVKRE